jgi:antirestriction protein
MNTNNSPRVYFACLAAYNAGALHGAWVDIDQDADAIRDEIAAMLKASPEPGAEEWAAHDYDNGPAFLGEFPDLDALATYGENFTEHGEAYAEFCENSYTVEDPADFQHAYSGTWNSGADYAETLAHDAGMLPDHIAWPITHIDWARAWRDLECDGYTAQDAPNGVYIFRPI